MRTPTILSPSAVSLCTDTHKHKRTLFRLTPTFLRFGLLRSSWAAHPFIFCLPPNPLVALDDDDTQQPYESKSVRVKVEIQKECAFGDELILVGNDPMIGMWDPQNGIALTWSEGHVWSVEMEVPIAKRIEFKLVVKESGGDVTWQPGGDRSFQSWETNKMIRVCEEWEDGEQQKVIEDDTDNTSSDNTSCSPMECVSEDSVGLNEITCEGDPVLVQGLSSCEAVEVTNDKNISIGFGVADAVTA